MSVYKIYTRDHYSIVVEADEVKTNNFFILFSLDDAIVACMSLSEFAYYEMDKSEQQVLPVTASSQLTHMEDPYKAAEKAKNLQ